MPVPAITGRVKTHPQIPVLAVTGQKKAHEDNIAFSTLPEDFLVFLLLLKRNKPTRMDLLSVFLEDFRGPRKMVFCLKIMRSKSAGNHGLFAGQN